ncbi:hypothetical protein [Hugenholtzia roseola]|uniref:hypothetical protein n=1 Tax=Hugenholtzia roseola TaxID=1002 RepID=UPI0003FD4624|nr:hypothetical protein [Hugenholtzia roseola]
MQHLQTIFALLKLDNLNILRDKTLLMMLFLPFLLMFGLKLGIDSLLGLVPQMETYLPLTAAVLATTTGLLGGYVVAFVMLDEKDENTFVVIRVMPLPTWLFLLYRLLYAWVWAFAFTLLTFLVFDVLDYTWVQKVSAACLCAQTAPLAFLLVVTFAKNKIEGMTFIKGINFIVMLPAVAFFVGEMLQPIFFIFPHFWTFLSLQKPNGVAVFASIMTHLLSGVFLFRLFAKKNR